MVFGRELHRWESRVTADFLRDHLIDRCIQLQNVAFVRNRAAEESRAADGVARLTAIVQSRYDNHIVPEWFERFQNR